MEDDMYSQEIAWGAQCNILFAYVWLVFAALQISCGKVMISVVSVCSSVHGGTNDAISEPQWAISQK